MALIRCSRVEIREKTALLPTCGMDCLFSIAQVSKHAGMPARGPRRSVWAMSVIMNRA